MEDRRRTGWDWLPIERLERHAFYPKGGIDDFRKGCFDSGDRYLGDIHGAAAGPPISGWSRGPPG